MSCSVTALPISTSYCRAHWLIELKGPSLDLIAMLEGNQVHWIRIAPGLSSPEGLSAITFDLSEKSPAIGEIKNCIWLPEHLTRLEGPCPCMEWVFGVIWNYQRLCYMTDSADGTTLDNLMDRLVYLSTIHLALSSREY